MNAPKGWTLKKATSIGSTNDALFSDHENRTFFWAGEQTKGKGRHDRGWVSEYGGLYVSFKIDSPLPDGMENWIQLITGVCAVKTLRAIGVDATLKWPNDIIFHGKKIGGILARSRHDGVSRTIIIGTGMNINNPPPLENATSVSLIAGSKQDIGDLVQIFIEKIADAMDSLPDGLGNYQQEYRTFCSTIGLDARIETESGELLGKVKDVDNDGALLVDTQNGVKRILAGDCIHLR